jgi:hypothetical protein
MDLHNQAREFIFRNTSRERGRKQRPFQWFSIELLQYVMLGSEAPEEYCKKFGVLTENRRLHRSCSQGNDRT